MTAPLHPGREATEPIRPSESGTPNRRARRLALLGAAAAVIATVGVAAALLDRSADDSSVADPVVLELSTGDLDPALMSCLPVSAEVVAQSPVAFRAIVDGVDGETVTMTVDEWYRGGDADVVRLTAPAGMEALIGGIEFTPGDAVLITAWDGVVNYCGFSGPATPELQAVFTEAFGG